MAFPTQRKTRCTPGRRGVLSRVTLPRCGRELSRPSWKGGQKRSRLAGLASLPSHAVRLGGAGVLSARAMTEQEPTWMRVVRCIGLARAAPAAGCVPSALAL